jgi:pimeloyl-ACP methyl ester carboxylesterase
MPSSFSRDAARAAGAAAASAAGAALTLAALNALVHRTAPPPQNPLGVAPNLYAWTAGDVSYSVSGKGPAVLLLHGIYAGASSYEFHRIFPLLSQHFRVFAPDLPGCGLSARPAKVYDPDLYVQFIHDFVQQVMGGVDHPVHLIASSLTCAFAVRAVVARPDLFERLALIEPTGIDQLAHAPKPTQRFLGKLIRTPLVGTSLYNLLVSRPSLRFYLKQQAYRDKTDVTDDIVDAYYAMAHQPNARYTASSFLGGTLNLNIADDFELLRQPTLLCWGRDAVQSPIECAEAFLERNARAELAIFDHSSGLPHDEEADDFALQVRNWLRAGISSSRY